MQDLKNRYKKFAIETGVLIQSLPRSIINTAHLNNYLDHLVRQAPITDQLAGGNQQLILLINLRLLKRSWMNRPILWS
jgi:hypothetical protein